MVTKSIAPRWHSMTRSSGRGAFPMTLLCQRSLSMVTPSKWLGGRHGRHRLSFAGFLVWKTYWFLGQSRQWQRTAETTSVGTSSAKRSFWCSMKIVLPSP